MQKAPFDLGRGLAINFLVLASKLGMDSVVYSGKVSGGVGGVRRRRLAFVPHLPVRVAL